MAYEITCPSGHKLQVRPEHFGKQVRCPMCSAILTVPDLSASTTEPGTAPTPPASTEPSAEKAKTGDLIAKFRKADAKKVGYVLLIVGLMGVLLARCGDALAGRNADRLQAKLKQAQADFDRKWTDEKDAAKDDKKAEVDKNRDEARKKLEKEDWLRLKRASEDAPNSRLIWGYWRELVFIVGAIVLLFGLLTVAVKGDGAERIVCLIMIAVIICSIFGGLNLAAAIRGLSG